MKQMKTRKIRATENLHPIMRVKCLSLSRSITLDSRVQLLWRILLNVRNFATLGPLTCQPPCDQGCGRWLAAGITVTRDQRCLQLDGDQKQETKD